MEDLIDVLLKEVGTKESPPNSNNVKYNTWFYGKEVSGKQFSWCMVLISWGLAQIGKPLKGFGYLRGAAGCSTALELFAKGIGGHIIDAKDAQRGDLVFYHWNGKEPDHVGAIVERLADEIHFRVIEGNTSSNNDSDGGEVEDRRDRKYEYPGTKIKLTFVRLTI